jgi:hypothetical protein
LHSPFEFSTSIPAAIISFLIRRINQFESDRGVDPITVEALDAFKQRAYEYAQRCFELRRAEQLDGSLRARLRHAAAELPLSRPAARQLLEGR